MDTKPKKNIDWLNHGLEFFVVLAGILLAFQLTEWNVQNKQQELTQQHVNNLLEEARFNSMMLKNATEQLQHKLTLTEQFLERQLVSRSAEELNEIMIRLIAVESVYLKRNAYASLIDTGDVSFIENFELKNQIVTLYEYFTWIKSLDESESQFQVAYLNPFATRELDIAEGMAQPLPTYTTKEVRNVIGGLKYILNIKLQKYKECQVKVKDLIESLTHKN